MSHTPGPWLLTKRSIYALTQKGWRKGEPCMVNRFFADVQLGHECSQDEAEANARLIAAAPELLEALEEITEAFSSKCGEWENPEFNECYVKAVAAIKKARHG